MRGRERRGVDDLGKMSERSCAGLRKGGSRHALAGRGRCRGQGRNRSVAGTQAGHCLHMQLLFWSLYWSLLSADDREGEYH